METPLSPAAGVAALAEGGSIHHRPEANRREFRRRNSGRCRPAAPAGPDQAPRVHLRVGLPRGAQRGLRGRDGKPLPQPVRVQRQGTASRSGPGTRRPVCDVPGKDFPRVRGGFATAARSRGFRGIDCARFVGRAAGFDLVGSVRCAE